MAVDSTAKDKSLVMNGSSESVLTPTKSAVLMFEAEFEICLTKVLTATVH